MTTEPTTEDLDLELLPPDAETRLRRAMAATPYAAGIIAPRTGTALEAAATFLEALIPVLDRVADQARQNVAELEELRRQRAAVRAFLGTGSEA